MNKETIINYNKEFSEQNLSISEKKIQETLEISFNNLDNLKNDVCEELVYKSIPINPVVPKLNRQFGFNLSE